MASDAAAAGIGRPTKFNRRYADRFLRVIGEPVPDPREKGGHRYPSNEEAARAVGWGVSTLYAYLAIGKGAREGRAHPQAAAFLEFLEAYEAADLVREESRIDAARKVIADDLAGRRVKTTIKTVAVTISGTTPLQRLVAALEGEPITTISQIYPDRGIGKAFLAAREVAQAGERLVRVEKTEEPQLPSTIVARWQEDRTRYRRQAAEAGGAGPLDPADGERFLPQLRMLLGADPELRLQVRALCDELAAET